MPDFTPQRLDWNDLRLVLAVARSGSFAGAAVQLKVSTPTVFRHAKGHGKAPGHAGLPARQHGRVAHPGRTGGRGAGREDRGGDRRARSQSGQRGFRSRRVDPPRHRGHADRRPADAGRRPLSARPPRNPPRSALGHRHGKSAPARGRCRPSCRRRAIRGPWSGGNCAGLPWPCMARRQLPPPARRGSGVTHGWLRTRSSAIWRPCSWLKSHGYWSRAALYASSLHTLDAGRRERSGLRRPALLPRRWRSTPRARGRPDRRAVEQPVVPHARRVAPRGPNAGALDVPGAGVQGPAAVVPG